MKWAFENKGETGEIDRVLSALASIYTGTFLINLKNDTYSKVSATDSIVNLLEGNTSAQEAINLAIRKTVFHDEIIEMLTFVNLSTLPKRMEKEKSLDTEYKGMLSGWIRGSFIEVEREEDGTLSKVLYAYQVVDEEKRKQLEHIQELKDNYVAAEYAENNYRTIHRLIKSGMWRMYCDENWEICRAEWSDEFRKMVGYTNEEDFPNVLDSWRNLLHPDDYEIGYGLIEAAIKDPTGKTIYDCEYRLKTKKQGYRWFRATGDVSRKPDGTPYCCFGVFFDITAEKERAKLERQRNEALETANKALEAMDNLHKALESGSWTFLYDESGKMSSVKWSSAFRALLGFDREEEFPDKWESWFERIHPEESGKVFAMYRQTLADKTGENTYNMELRVLKKNHKYHWFQAFGRLLRREDGSPETFYGILMDINERKKTEEKLQQTTLMAQKASAAKTDFLRRMSHDIRTPINGIRGMIEIANHVPDDIEKQRECRQKIWKASGYLLSLVNNILDMNKLESGVIELVDEPFSLEDVLAESNTIAEMQATEHGVTYKIDEHGNDIRHPFLRGSVTHLKQILQNIASNSVKYNKIGGNVTVSCKEIHSDENTATFCFTCKDTGVGMSKEFQKHAFDTFSQENRESHTTYSGTGLGLPIVKELVEKMGGRIEFESEMGIGTIFHITLSFAIDAERKPDEEEEETATDICGVKVLLVEDNEMNMEIAKFILEDSGAVVTCAENGQVALDMFTDAEPGTFDVIMSDIMMPVMDGLEFTRNIRNLEREDAKNIPIFAMSANAFLDDIKRSKDAGMNEHFVKPLEIDLIVKTVQRYMKMSGKINLD